MGSLRLNQVLAVEKSLKDKAKSAVTQLHRVSQQEHAFQGLARQYTPKNDKGVRFPDESKRVQLTAQEVLRGMAGALSQLFNCVHAKDMANCNARADVVVDGQVVLPDAPATFLLFLEKQLNDVHTLVSKMATLDEAYEWNRPTGSEISRTQPIETIRTEKVQEALTLAEATKEHPAQAQMITKDVVVGTWSTTQLSGALSVKERRTMIERVDKLRIAVKQARERANMTEATDAQIGGPLFTYILTGKTEGSADN